LGGSRARNVLSQLCNVHGEFLILILVLVFFFRMAGAERGM
jgi:hypothetical protein